MFHSSPGNGESLLEQYLCLHVLVQEEISERQFYLNREIGYMSVVSPLIFGQFVEYYSTAVSPLILRQSLAEPGAHW